ncbi:MAG: hypothetical protein E7773_10170 [Sphingomonas sp.]|uniref:phage terminase large subunit n=1 Tax=Sphingomonas sp. TaxID=28214 RepID=UPI00120455DC|nr:phage terminase large subunit [Sphingomonas sp.]THD35703.1 MAG: hypothetical protein E7773_10170 [Sphingomonas sp.]
MTAQQPGLRLDTFKPRHIELFRLSETPAVKYLMAAGGIRSGKSVTLATIIIARAMQAPGSRHGIFHAYGNACYRNLFNLTIPETFEIIAPGWYPAMRSDKTNNPINKSDHTITLPNGSMILFGGLDDPDKHRGTKFSTVWINEANFVNYDAVMTLQGRLSEAVPTVHGTILPTLMLFDLNPTVKSSWEHKVFVEGVVPGDEKPLANAHRYRWLHVNPADNRDNLPDDYFELFDGMTEEQRRRDELGLWAEDNPNALFDLNKIGRRRCHKDDLAEIIVAVDPATSSHDKSDMTGIIVVGRNEAGHYFVLEDATMKAKPEVWAQKAIDLYHAYEADCIVAEKNQGGDMVETVIARATVGGSNVPVRLVHASRGKRIRAEPVAVLYEKELVNHVSVFRELEQQMIEFDAPGFKGSPDRVDALVWGLTYLSQSNGVTPARFSSFKPRGLWGSA